MIKELDIALLIAFFGFYGNSVEGRTRLQKDICILKHQERIPFNFDFESHYFGPYSSELTDTIDTLVAAGLLNEKLIISSQGNLRYDYSLTNEGRRLFESVKKLLEKYPNLSAMLEAGVRQLKGKSLSEVIALAKKCSGIQSSI